MFGMIFYYREIFDWQRCYGGKQLKNTVNGFAWFLIVKYDLMSDYKSKRF